MGGTFWIWGFLASVLGSKYNRRSADRREIQLFSAKETEVDAQKIPIACDKCGKKFSVDAALAGRAVKCPCTNV